MHRRACARVLRAVGGKLEHLCTRHEDSLDRFLSELDASVVACSSQLREGLLGLQELHGLAAPVVQQAEASAAQADGAAAEGGAAGGPWAWARRAALQRGEGDEVDCPICFQECDLQGRGGARLELLSCSHIFHRCCIVSFESFHVFEKHICPVCRQHYERRPWLDSGAQPAPLVAERSPRRAARYTGPSLSSPA